MTEKLPIIQAGSDGRRAEAGCHDRATYPEDSDKPGGSTCHSELVIKDTVAVSASAFCFKQGIVGKRDAVGKAEV